MSAPVTAGFGASIGDALSTTFSGVSSGVDAAVGAVRAGQWLANPHNWVRISYVIVGAGLVLIGAGMLTGRGTVGPAVKAASVVAKV